MKIKDTCKRFSSGKNILATQISTNAKYPVFGGNGLRGYTDTYNFDGACAVIGRQGAYCGNVKFFSGKAYMTEHAVVAEPTEQHNARFLAYKLALMDLGKYAGQSAQPGLSVATIGDLDINMPSLCEQNRIANVLGSIEERIENNNAICAELEAMAKLLYDYWFVQFDFPDENGNPYKSSGGKMAWSEELKREIPEGWNAGNLYNIADFINGLACQKFRPEVGGESLPVIKIGEMHDGITEKTERVRADIPQKNIIQDGDILFSWSATLETMIWTGGVGGLNQHIFKVVPKLCSKHYVYQQLSAYILNFVKMAEARKTTMGHITTDHLKQSKIALPPKNIVALYEERVESIYSMVLTCRQENRNLASLRDFLLPLLMNGQVGFKEVDCH